MATTESAPIGYRRNFIMLVGNYVTFSWGLSFFSSNTVMPVFLRHFTDSAPLIGLVTVVFPLMWILPQLIAARWIAHRKRRKPFLVWPSIGAPVVFAMLAGMMFLAGSTGLKPLLPAFVVAVVVLGLVDGFVGVPWLDFVGSAIPAGLRGRLMGLQEALFAVGTIGVGALVSFFLGENGPQFPFNFAWLATCAAAAYFIALLFFVFLREPRQAGDADRRSPWSEYLPLLGHIMKSDRALMNMILVRLLNGCAELALPFYVLYATTELGLPPATAGLFLTAQVVGSACGSLALGYLYERYGSRLVIRIVTFLSLAAPLAALFAPASGLHGAGLEWLFAAVFFTVGVSGVSASALFIGFTNFVIDHSTPEQRPAYIGLANALSGPAVLAAILGGWILQRTSYAALFVLTAAVLLLAQFFAARLPEPRRR